MSNVIHLVTAADEIRVDSREIAAGLGVKSRSANILIDRYMGRFQRFGVLAFEMAKPKEGGKGGRPERFALLNEDQCYFLLSLSRNTERVVDMKANLVQAFGSARRNGVAQALSVWQELQRLQLEDADSFAKASFGSHLMLDRKRALPNLRDRRRSLERQFAPQLKLVA